MLVAGPAFVSIRIPGTCRGNAGHHNLIIMDFRAGFGDKKDHDRLNRQYFVSRPAPRRRGGRRWR